MDLWARISFNIISGIYETVARVYDILMQIVNNEVSSVDFTGFAENVYILAGVFILFRVTIGMIHMIINPDAVSDKQVGAGKLMTRIIVSVVMLLVFYPGGLIFGETGILNRVEDAVVGNGKDKDGLIDNLFNADYEITQSTKSTTNNLLYEDVYAAEKELVCYYYDIDENNNMFDDVTRLGQFYKITYTTSNKSGYTKMKKSDSNVKGAIYYKVSTGKVGGGEYGDVYYSGLPGSIYDERHVFENDSIWSWQEDKVELPDKCPKLLRYKEESGYVHVYENGTVGRNDIYGGYKTLSGMIKDIKKEYNRDGVETDNEILQGEGVGKGKSLKNSLEYGDEALAFAQGVAKSFQTCTISDNSDPNCDDLQSKMFDDKQTKQQIITEMGKNDPEFSVDFLTSLIAGIGIIIYLIILCVDVIVRQFKMMLLEMLAPIPIASYVDPKDKVFNQWMKMLVATYLELFIKILGIKIVVILLDGIWDNFDSNGNVLITFFFIVALLVFAKLVPSMISKIFGLDSMGGSFKDIMGMAKSATGAFSGGTIGGAIGGLAGAVYGAQGRKGFGKILGGAAGAISGGLSGAISGAASGSKGKVMAGAQAVSAKHATKAQQRADGLNILDRMIVGAYNTGGVTPFGGKYKEQMEKSDDVEKARSDVDKWAKDELIKKGAIFRAGDVNNGKAILSKDKDNPRFVTGANEEINMKNEYKRQSIMAGLTSQQWNSMSVEDKVNEFGAMAVYEQDANGNVIVDNDGNYVTRSLGEAQVFMDDRIAALEDYGKAIRVNKGINSGDDEAIKKVNFLRGKIDDANHVGVDEIKQIPAGANFDNNTLKNVKDQANSAYNSIGDANEKAIKRQKYIKGGS